jgi:hypothetical protein
MARWEVVEADEASWNSVAHTACLKARRQAACRIRHLILTSVFGFLGMGLLTVTPS